MSTCASQLRGNLDCSLGVSLALPPLFQIVLPIEKTLPKETVQQRKVIPSLILRKYYMRKPWINIDKSINNIPFLECTTSTVSLLLLLCGNFYFLVVSFFLLCGNRNRVAILYQRSTRKLSIKCIFILYLNAMIAIYRCCTTLLFQMDQVHIMLLVVDFDSKNCFHFFSKFKAKLQKVGCVT